MKPARFTQKDLAFSKRLQKIRKKIDITQEELATKTGLSTTFIGLLETGKRRASLKTLQKISSALGVKANELLPY